MAKLNAKLFNKLKNVDISRYCFFIILLIIINVLYKDYLQGEDNQKALDDYNIIQKYIINKTKNFREKPYLWVHRTFDVNARNWESFGSRTSNKKNQPYLNIVIKSLIEKCGESFNIIVIDDNSFGNILKDWYYDLSTMSSPIKENFRYYGILQLLYNFGGFVVPESFLCLKSLKQMYYDNLTRTNCFTVEMVNNSKDSDVLNFVPNPNFIAAKKNSTVIKGMLSSINIKIKSNQSAELKINRYFSKLCDSFIKRGEMSIVNGKFVGVKTINMKPVYVEDLMSEHDLNFSKKLFGIYIPAEDLLRRNHYNWFVRLSKQQSLDTTSVLSRLLIASQ